MLPVSRGFPQFRAVDVWGHYFLKSSFSVFFLRLVKTPKHVLLVYTLAEPWFVFHSYCIGLPNKHPQYQTNKQTNKQTGSNLD